MQLGKFIDMIYTQINGGRPSTDSVVTKAQIKAMLPAAVNYALTGDYWANIRMEGDREVPGAFIAELNVKELKTDARGRDYIDFKEKVVNIGGNGGIRYVEDGAGNKYSPRPQGASPSYWDKVLCELREFQHKKDKIYLYNRDYMVEDFFVGVILDVSELSDEDELPLPAGTEVQAIDIVRAFFNDQRMNPKDYIINGVDPVNETTNG